MSADKTRYKIRAVNTQTNETWYAYDGVEWSNKAMAEAEAKACNEAWPWIRYTLEAVTDKSESR